MLPVLAQVVGTVEHVNQAGDAEGADRHRALLATECRARWRIKPPLRP